MELGMQANAGMVLVAFYPSSSFQSDECFQKKNTFTTAGVYRWTIAGLEINNIKIRMGWTAVLAVPGIILLSSYSGTIAECSRG